MEKRKENEKETKFRIFRCAICGEIVLEISGESKTLMCCGQKMEELIPQTIDELKEKHVPYFKVRDNTLIVNIGLDDHPMMDKHWIEWVLAVTNRGFKLNHLCKSDKPHTRFELEDDEYVQKVLCYCNIHGLWEKDCGCKIN